MAEGDGAIYNCLKAELFRGTHNLAAGGNALYMALMHGYVPDIDLDTTFAGIATEYLTALGYTAGGKLITGQAVTQDNVNNRGKFDANDVAWAGLGPLLPVNPPSHCVLYNLTAGGKLICYWELGFTPTAGSTYTLVFGTAIIYLT